MKRVLQEILGGIAMTFVMFATIILLLMCSGHKAYAAEEWIEVGTCTITHYCPCARCNGRANQPTASGVMPERYRTAAVDPKVIPIGSTIYIDGYGYRIAEDTGVRGNWVDVFTDSHQHALDLGLKKRTVWIVKEVEE